MSVALAASASAQPKIPPDYAFPQGKDSPGVVTFSHLKHKEKVEKCQGCHTKIFKMKKSRPGAFSMQEMRAGDLCGACHNGRTEVKGAVVFDVDDRSHCERCHKKE
jgi:c(7)-type cytochrome triheme protein